MIQYSDGFDKGFIDPRGDGEGSYGQGGYRAVDECVGVYFSFGTRDDEVVDFATRSERLTVCVSTGANFFDRWGDTELRDAGTVLEGGVSD